MRKSERVDLQIRGVPAALRDKIRRRARSKGLSMSKYVIDLLRSDLTRPTINDWLEEVSGYPPVPGVSGGALIRELRDELEAGIER